MSKTVTSLEELNVAAYEPRALLPAEFSVEIPFTHLAYSQWLEHERCIKLATAKLIERGYDCCVWDDPELGAGRMKFKLNPARAPKPVKRPLLDDAIDV